MEKKLNKEQLQAIKHKSGPLLIIAGAGTGKTTVITERIKYLITKGLAKPEEILALTFTEKGAKEMEERVDIALPLGYTQMWIMTFHSFCDRVLRESAIHIGLDPKYDLMTQAESIDLLKKNIFDLGLDYFKPLGNPNKFLEGLLNHFSRLQDEDISPVEYINWASNKYQVTGNKLTQERELEQKKWKELVRAYEKYQELKVKNNLMDFSDLLTYTLKLFRERPNVLKEYRTKFKYILIDEFQDTNYIQNELAILLAGDDKRITVVADDDQSIYRWRGASVSNVMQFKKTFKKAKIIVLSKNYRSNQEILDKSYNLIQHNNPNRLEVLENINKKLTNKNSKKTKENVSFLHFKNSSDETVEVSKLIIQLISKSIYQYSDIAILVRANNHASGFIREFERSGIPHQFLGPSKLFEREEIVDLISYLKSLVNPEDSRSFYRLISSDFLDVEPVTLIKLNSLSKRQSKSLFEVVADLPAQAGNTHPKLIKIIEITNRHLKEINKKSAGEILYEYIHETKLLEKYVNNENETAVKNISTFFQKIKAYEDENSKAKIFDVCEYIDLLTEVGESPIVTEGDWQENNMVNILTVHSAKGLEFPVVFVVNLVSDRFPSRECHEQIPIPDDLVKETLPLGDFHLQEERRLFYVAMTRAKERLYLTAANYYGDGKREKKISPFVKESLGEIPNYQLPITNLQSINNFQVSNHPLQTTRLRRQANHQSLVINFLSVSQIETFRDCPLHYKLKYIYKVPTPLTASISFGISIHNTLKQMLNDKKLNTKLTLKYYKENWIEDGYLNKKHKLEFYKKGESYLLGFLKNEYDSKIKTIALEKDFKLKISKDLTVGGKIDRVDDLGDGMYEVIDYKTGATIPEQKTVDKDLQLSVYATAVSEMYKTSPEKIKLSLYYLDTQEKIITSRTTKQLEEVKQEILEVKKEIENSDFKCNNSYFCQRGCEFKMFCKSEKTI